MRLTHWTDYTLRVLLFCAATQNREKAPTVSEIATLHQISKSHLMKIVMELAANGVIVRLWRIPGRRQNVGLWRATTAGALHAALESLPTYPYLDITVPALASHPSDPHERS